MKQLFALSLDNLLCFLELESTNDYAKQNYKTINSTSIIYTDNQTNGRGQFNRKWNSNSNENLTFSILYKNVPLNYIQNIRQHVSSSIIRLLASFYVDASFKYPNDIYVENNKICGILIETSISEVKDEYDYIVIGIGLNVNQTDFINLPNTISIKKLINRNFDLREVLKKFIDIYNVYI